jgi:endonuclease-3
LLRIMAAEKDIKNIIKLLKAGYEIRDWTTNMKPIDVLVGTILSQNTTDKNSIRAYHNLVGKYKNWNRVMNADVNEIADTIRSGGLPMIKAKRIQATLREIKKRTGKLDLDSLHDMNKDEATEFLISLHGVGPKTAAVVLAFCFGKATIAVDTHIHRVVNRLGITHEKTPEKTQKKLNEIIPDELKNDFHLLIIEHGRSVCKSQNPRCRECVLNKICEFYNQ